VTSVFADDCMRLVLVMSCHFAVGNKLVSSGRISGNIGGASEEAALSAGGACKAGWFVGLVLILVLVS
jgi:hypothetical protein